MTNTYTNFICNNRRGCRWVHIICIIKIFPNIQNVTYEGKILKLIKNNNLIRFVNYDILQLKDISLKKIEDYISTNGVSRKDDFKDLKNIILKLFIYLKYADTSYEKINNISFNFTKDEKSIFTSGYCYHLRFDSFLDNFQKTKHKVYKKDLISELKFQLQPNFSFSDYHRINGTSYVESGEKYPYVSINFDKKYKQDPFLEFYNNRIERENKRHALEKEYNKIKKYLENKCLELNIPFSIYIPCKIHQKDLWTIIFTWEHNKEDELFYQYFNNYHEKFKVLLKKTDLSNVENYIRDINNYYFIHIPLQWGIHSYSLSDSKHILNYADVKKDINLSHSDNYKIILHLEENII